MSEFASSFGPRRRIRIVPSEQVAPHDEPRLAFLGVILDDFVDSVVSVPVDRRVFGMFAQFVVSDHSDRFAVPPVLRLAAQSCR
jgi:hypothetical protein